MTEGGPRSLVTMRFIDRGTRVTVTLPVIAPTSEGLDRWLGKAVLLGLKDDPRGVDQADVAQRQGQ